VPAIANARRHSLGSASEGQMTHGRRHLWRCCVRVPLELAKVEVRDRLEASMGEVDRELAWASPTMTMTPPGLTSLRISTSPARDPHDGAPLPRPRSRNWLKEKVLRGDQSRRRRRWDGGYPTPRGTGRPAGHGRCAARWATLKGGARSVVVIPTECYDTRCADANFSTRRELRRLLTIAYQLD
jgi:hypothetical protein